MSQMHSIFLHVRRLRRMAGVRDAKSVIVKVEWILNWLTFVFARFVPHILITAKLIMDASKFDKGVELPLALSGMAGMNLLNALLGIDLLNAVRKESNYQKTDQSHHEWRRTNFGGNFICSFYYIVGKEWIENDSGEIYVTRLILI